MLNSFAMTQSTQIRKCLFCGSPANSREHVFAEWLSKRMAIRNLAFGTATFTETTGITKRTAMKAEHFKTKQVCKSCNEGWMSALEVWFQKRLGYMIEPNWPHLSIDMIQCLRDEGESLIRWMIKTAVVFEQVIPERPYQVVPDNVRVMAKEGVTTKDYVLTLAKISAPGFTAHLAKGFPVWNGGVLYPFLVHRDGFTFAVYLNHLAIRLVRCPGGSPIFKTPAPLAGCLPILPLWVSPPINYLDKVTHAYPSFEMFMDALEVKAQ